MKHIIVTLVLICCLSPVVVVYGQTGNNDDFSTVLKSSGEILKNPVDTEGNQKRLVDFIDGVVALGISETDVVCKFKTNAQMLIGFVRSNTTWNQQTHQILSKEFSKQTEKHVVLDLNLLAGPNGFSASSDSSGGASSSNKNLEQQSTNSSFESHMQMSKAESEKMNVLLGGLIQSYSRMLAYLRTRFIKEQIPGQWSWKWTQEAERTAVFNFNLCKDGTWTADISYYGNWPLIWSQFTVMKGTWETDNAERPHLTVDLTNVRKLLVWIPSQPSPFTLIDSAEIKWIRNRSLILNNPEGPELLRKN